MINRAIRNTVNLFLYGGLFIGLCAACITALTFELIGRTTEHLSYTLLVGTATAALYNLHRMIGLQKTAHLMISGRFEVIRQYQFHIRVYTVLWILLSFWLVLPLVNEKFLLVLLPAGLISFAYVIPFLPGGRRLRDLGWGKIVMISWSWAWLTAVVPLWLFGNASIQMIVMHGLERMLFIMLIAIPFEVRDLQLDRSLGLITMPAKIGMQKTRYIVVLLSVLILFLSFVASFHYFNLPYGLAMGTTTCLVYPLFRRSDRMHDDYYFAGLIDGMMIVALWLFCLFHALI